MNTELKIMTVGSKPGVISVPWKIWQCLEIFSIAWCGFRILLESGGKRPGMLLNVYRKSCRIGPCRYGREFSEQGNRKNNRAGALRWFNICPQMLFWRKGDPFQGPKLGSCLTLGNELSEETHVLTKQEILLGKSGEQLGKETQENSSVTWLGFVVMALVSR